MRLKILAFGIAKDILGNREFELEIEEGATTNDLKNALKRQFPAFHDLASLAVAVNSTYARDEVLLFENDEIALIPPVSGG